CTIVMSTLNSSSIPASFLLIGMPGLEDVYGWISIPFSLMFLTSFVGNGLVLLVITCDDKLRQPLYLFLAMLAACDFMFSLFTSPSVLGIYWCNSQLIRSQICLLQMFFIHSLSVIESALLVAMAFDRFVAICHPLRYTAILTNSVVTKIGLASALRGICIVFPIPFLTRRFPYCKSHRLSHSYCLHQDVIRLACADTTVNSLYGLIAVLLTKGLDSMFIIISYGTILQTVLSIKGNDARVKALSTCVCHVCAVLLFYVPLIGLSVVHRFGKHASPLLPVLMADVYLLVPPVINPVIYSIKTKQIRQKIPNVFSFLLSHLRCGLAPGLPI
uniref:Olfactory receptor n=1 Tax=Leptobrachium leishanense TaxID=445787 RepID=A0A8C5M6L5_9ANUR